MKQTLQNRFPRRWLLLAFVLNFAIAAAALLPYMIRDGVLLLVAADFDAEQLSYNMLCNNAIKSGEVLWNWRIDIGSDFVSSFSFYTLGSPFFWLSFLFPASAFPYLVGWIYMLKYAVAGKISAVSIIGVGTGIRGFRVNGHIISRLLVDRKSVV